MKRVVTLLLLAAFLAPYQPSFAEASATATTITATSSAKTSESVLKRKKKRRGQVPAYKRNQHRKKHLLF